MSLISIVDEDDKVIGIKERGTLASEDIYRVAVLWIVNEAGDFLLAQQASGKKYPGRWVASVGGTVEADETYETNVVKEAGEELGLAISQADLKEGPKERIRTDRSNHFSQSYFYLTDRSADGFVIDKSETQQLRWFPRAELKRIVSESPDTFSPPAARSLRLFLM
jgi:isopentenyldiphosphate isomerase